MNTVVIKELREYYNLPPHISDEDIQNKLKGSLGEAIINFRLARKNLKDEIYKASPQWFKKLTNYKIGGN